MAVILTRPDATDGVLKCGNAGAVGTSPCYDGVQAYLACDSLHTKTADTATPPNADVYHSVDCKLKKFEANTTVYDLMPATSTDTATIDGTTAASGSIGA